MRESSMFSVISLVNLNVCCGLLLATLEYSHGARILGICPTPFLSHQLPFQVIMKALAAKGHKVTVISPSPLEVPVENYTDIDLSFSHELWANSVDLITVDEENKINFVEQVVHVLHDIIDAQLSAPQVQTLISSNETFDLVIMEKLVYLAYYGLVHHVGSPPVIGYLSFGGMVPSYSAYGSPPNPAYFPDLTTPFTDHMNFWERFYNAYVSLRLSMNWHYRAYVYQESIMRKHFGAAPPSVYESVYNDSLLLTNYHWILNYPAPMPPGVIQLTGLHIQKTRKNLPKDIQDFLDGAENGVIYFSFGSKIMINLLPDDKRKHILEAFSALPQRIIFKWESDTLQGKPSNVIIGKWLPQQDILAHPNVRAFISHGGLQSFQEALYHGVPVIGVPFMGDQHYNVVKYQNVKIGLRLDLEDLTKDTLLEALDQIINDTSYRDNMKILSQMYREHQSQSLNKAIWWIEYVLRYNGARHLRLAALDLTWYQNWLMDIIAVLIVGIILTVTITYLALKKTILIFKSFSYRTKLKQM